MIQDYQIQEFLRQAHRVGDAGLTLCSSGNISWRIGDEALVSGTGSWVPTLPKEKVSICRVATGEVLNGVKRWSSLGREPFTERVGDVEWHLSLIVPACTFFGHEIADLSGRSMRCNAYKCGDLLERPHFLSWAPIPIAAPDFHRPDFFAPMQMG